MREAAALAGLLIAGCTSAVRLDLGDTIQARADHNDGFGGVSLGVHHTADDTWWFQGAAGDVWVGGPPMTPDATFEVASVTKTFTAVAVLQAVEEGRIGLDDTLGAWLGARATGLLVIDGVDHGPQITVRQLLHHDSGLPDYWMDPPYVRGDTNTFLAAFLADPARVWAPDELIDAAAALDPIGVPGERWHYADTNYVLLGLILEAADGAPYHEVIRARVLTPLDLGHTWLSYHEQPTSTAPESHRYEGTDDLHAVPRQGADWAGGGLVSAQADLVTFVEAIADGRLFAADTTRDLLLDVQPTGEAGVGYGLGVFGVDLGDSGHLWGHDGYGGAFVYAWPEQGITLTGTVNQTGTDPWPLVLAAVRAVEAR